MAAVDVNTYNMKEFQFALKPEAAVGTKLNTSMQLLQLAGDVTVSKEVIQDTTQRAGVGRTMKVADVHTTDKGGVRTTLSVPVVLDTTVDTMILEGLTWVETGASPSSVDIAYDYAPSALAHGGAPSATNIGTFTACMISPIANESRYWVGACIEAATISMDIGTDGGRRTATLTIVTEYYEEDAAAAPTGMSAYGATYRYLYELGTTKTIGGDVMVMNKLELTITNAVSYFGFQGSNGDPEGVQRAVSGGRIEIAATAGVKYDSNTAEHWQNQRAGTIFALELSNNATWASATFGLKADYCKLNAEVVPGDTDQGAFQDLSFIIGASTSGDVIQIVP